MYKFRYRKYTPTKILAKNICVKSAENALVFPRNLPKRPYFVANCAPKGRANLHKNGGPKAFRPAAYGLQHKFKL